MSMKKEKNGRSVVANIDEFIRGFKDESHSWIRTLKEFGVRVGVQQGFVLAPSIFAIVVDVVTEHAREELLHEILMQMIWC